MSLLDDCDLLIFDCDGVLVDSEVLAVEAFVAVMNEAGVKATTAMVVRCFGMKQADILLQVSEATGQAIPEGVGERLWPVTRTYFEHALKPMPGIAAFLDAVPGKRRCVASSSNPERIRTSLGLTGLTEAFGAHVFSSHQVARGKPAPDLFLFAATTMGVDPARCLVVEDSTYGVQGAIAAGMTAFGFVGGSHIPVGHAEALSAAGATSVEKSWDDVLRRISA
jgi:HAD superfamily hydrolase (TIGR01509 family)